MRCENPELAIFVKVFHFVEGSQAMVTKKQKEH